ncbi:MAG: hypothetical protein QOE89_2789 [Pseudonocardiales bacterium]|nr:hypothetical protein [Pseudonocardiales bacterium]
MRTFFTGSRRELGPRERPACGGACAVLGRHRGLHGLISIELSGLPAVDVPATSHRPAIFSIRTCLKADSVAPASRPCSLSAVIRMLTTTPTMQWLASCGVALSHFQFSDLVART